MEKLLELIAKSYSVETATAYKACQPTEAQLDELAEIGRDVLAHFPSVAGACAPMTAVYAVRWEMEPRPPIYVVAGELYANRVRVFGSDSLSKTINADINQSNPAWDGHYWLVFGPYVADISIFRTAYSNYSPPALAKHVKERCGTGRGLLIANELALDELGFKYIPHAVLTADQVTAHFGSANIFFESQH
jgi:hypothetical protein